MLTLLAVIGVLIVLFVAAVVATHNDEVLIDVLPDAADLDLPKTAIQAEDLAALRFSQAIRGYRMDEVDGVLERVSAELSARDRRLGALQAELVTAKRGKGSPPAAAAGPQLPSQPVARPSAPSPVPEPVQLTKPVAENTPPSSAAVPPAPAPAGTPPEAPAGRRPDSPLTGFSLPDISPSGWTADSPSAAQPAAGDSPSASTQESGEWFFDPARSVDASADEPAATPTEPISPAAPGQTPPTAPRTDPTDPTTFER